MHIIFARQQKESTVSGGFQCLPRIKLNFNVFRKICLRKDDQSSASVHFGILPESREATLDSPLNSSGRKACCFIWKGRVEPACSASNHADACWWCICQILPALDLFPLAFRHLNSRKVTCTCATGFYNQFFLADHANHQTQSRIVQPTGVWIWLYSFLCVVCMAKISQDEKIW